MGAVKWQRQYHAMLAPPLGVHEPRARAPVLHPHAGDDRDVVLPGRRTVLGAFTSPWAVLDVPVAVLCAAAFAAPVMAFSARQENEARSTSSSGSASCRCSCSRHLLPEYSQLPAWLQPVAWATPLWHATQLVRDLALERVDPLRAPVSLLYLSAGWRSGFCGSPSLLPVASGE